MFEEYLPAIERELLAAVPVTDAEYSKLFDAMRYSVSAGGKRVRPCLLMEFSKVCGADPFISVKFAAALEMIHTYSLIHDDLPCMDNDDMRRGKPSCHIAFGEADALLAGDALLTDSFKLALSTDADPALVLKAASVLSEYAGSRGMIGGQVIDLKYENTAAPLDAVKQMYSLKTGRLLRAAAEIGCIIAGSDDKKINAARLFAENIGLAFQIKDDILDITSTDEELGKNTGSDKENAKSTVVSHIGLDAAQREVDRLTEEAVSSLSVFGENAERLGEFAISLAKRKK